MNLIKTLRKPYLAILLSGLVLFVSCNQYDELVEENKIDASMLKTLHQNIKTGFDNAKSSTTLNKSNVFKDQVFEVKYIENVDFVNKNGIESLLTENKISTSIRSEFDFFMNNENNENVYQLLLNKFDIKTLKDASFLFNTIELSKIVQDNLNQNKTDLYAKTSISWGCAFAIAATVGCTIGFIWASAGSALIYAGAMKALATVAIIEACGEGWGDI